MVFRSTAAPERCRRGRASVMGRREIEVSPDGSQASALGLVPRARRLLVMGSRGARRLSCLGMQRGRSTPCQADGRSVRPWLAVPAISIARRLKAMEKALRSGCSTIAAATSFHGSGVMSNKGIALSNGRSVIGRSSATVTGHGSCRRGFGRWFLVAAQAAPAVHGPSSRLAWRGFRPGSAASRSALPRASLPPLPCL